MPYKIDKIEFDFDDDEYVWNTGEQQQIIDDVKGTSWIVNDENDLVDEITDYTGWCIKSIEYHLK